MRCYQIDFIGWIFFSLHFDRISSIPVKVNSHILNTKGISCADLILLEGPMNVFCLDVYFHLCRMNEASTWSRIEHKFEAGEKNGVNFCYAVHCADVRSSGEQCFIESYNAHVLIAPTPNSDAFRIQPLFISATNFSSQNSWACAGWLVVWCARSVENICGWHI